MKRVAAALILLSTTTLGMSIASSFVWASGASAASHDPTHDLSLAQAKANAAAKKLSGAQADLAQVQDKIDQLNSKLNRYQSQIGVLSVRVKQIAVSEFVGDHAADPVFGISGDINDDARRTAVMDGVAQTSQQSMNQYLMLRDALNKSQSDLNNQLSQQKGALASLTATQQSAVRDVNNLAKQVQAFKAQQAAAAAAAAAAKKSASSSSTKFVTSRLSISGDWLCPVAGPHAFSDDFGAPRAGGRKHQGNDILSPRGTPVVANVDGIVKYNYSANGGNSYYLEGADGNEYFGAHLESYAGVGKMSKGTVIGYVGNTGDAAGGPTHLHFEIHPGGGAAVDPYPTLKKYC